jgi:hypothetical protein
MNNDQPAEDSHTHKILDSYKNYFDTRMNSAKEKKLHTAYYKQVQMLLSFTDEQALNEYIFSTPRIRYCINRYIEVFPQDQDTIKRLNEISDNYLNVYLPKKRLALTADSKYLQIVREVLTFDTIDKCIEYLESNKVSNYNFNDWIYKYNLRYPDSLENYKKLQSIYEAHKEYVNIKSKNERELYIKQQKDEIEQERKEKAPIACQTLLAFINSNYKDIASFCSQNRIDENDFAKYTDIVKTYDEALYQKYIEKVEKLRVQRYAILSHIVRNIVTYIIDGIKVNDQNNRAFDLLDYYSLTKLTLKEFSEICENICSIDQLRLVKKFTNDNGNNHYIDKEKRFYREKITINNREVTIDEKRLIVNYLENQGFPLYDRIYSLAIKRYIKGTLFINSHINESNIQGTDSETLQGNGTAKSIKRP